MNIHSPKWTENRVAEASKLWAKGLSASNIAAEIGGVSRNAVAGLALRNRELFPQRGRKFKSVWAVPVIPATDYDTQSLHKPLLDLQANECRWPVGHDHRGHLFCGHEADGPYCKHHKARSVGHGTYSERNAVEDARRKA